MTTTNGPAVKLAAIINQIEDHLATESKDRFGEGFETALDMYLPELITLLDDLINSKNNPPETVPAETIPAETLNARNIDRDILIRAEVRQVYHTGDETILSVIHQYENPNSPVLTEIAISHDTPITFAGKATK